MSNVNLTKKTVNLSKKEVINLSKSSENGLKKIMVALGWDEAKAKVKQIERVVEPGFFGKLFGQKSRVVTETVRLNNDYEYDLDAWVAFLEDGVIKPSQENILYYGRKDLYNKDGTKYAHHCGDNLTGAGDGDDEQIILDLDAIPKNYNGVAIMVTIYSAKSRHQTFGDIENFFVRVVDQNDNFEICRYSDSVAQEYKDCYTFIVGKLYKDKGEWQFKSEGVGTKDGDISSAAANYRG